MTARYTPPGATIMAGHVRSGASGIGRISPDSFAFAMWRNRPEKRAGGKSFASHRKYMLTVQTAWDYELCHRKGSPRRFNQRVIPWKLRFS